MGRWLLAFCLAAHAGAQTVQVWEAREPEPEVAPVAADAEGGEEQAPAARPALAASPDAPANAVDADEALVDEVADLRKNTGGVQELGMEIDQNLLALQGAMDKGLSTADILRDKKMRETLKKAFQNNPMAKLPREELKPMLLAQIKGSPWEGVVGRFPKVLDFFMDFMRHPTAISSLVGILDRPRALKNCGIASLVSMVLIILLRKKVIGPRTKFFKRMGLQLMFSALFMSVSGAIFWLTFKEEIGPTWGVFRQTFL